jgi:hypothetical protein
MQNTISNSANSATVKPDGVSFRSFWTPFKGAAASLLLARRCGGATAGWICRVWRCPRVDQQTARNERGDRQTVFRLRIPKAQSAFNYSAFENQIAEWQHSVATSHCIQ